MDDFDSKLELPEISQYKIIRIYQWWLINIWWFEEAKRLTTSIIINQWEKYDTRRNEYKRFDNQAFFRSISQFSFIKESEYLNEKNDLRKRISFILKIDSISETA